MTLHAGLFVIMRGQCIIAKTSRVDPQDCLLSASLPYYLCLLCASSSS
jgi:hypothetical protein